MSRRRRQDYPNAWHHVFNRGIAKRALFETAQDIALFSASLAHVVERDLLEVHAFSILTTHFHLLVRSPAGQMSTALRIVQNAYSRAFNRSRKRDGPLVRGRYGSRRIDDAAYWETVVRYIDLNPVHAGLCELPSDYPHSSAHAYRWSTGPAWLTRSLVEAVVREACNTTGYEPRRYDTWATSIPLEVVRALVDARPLPSGQPHRFDHLVRGASLRQQAWMELKARLADGECLGTVLLSPSTALLLVERRRQREPDLKTSLRARSGSLWDVLAAGLLQECCGLTGQRAAELLEADRGTVYHRMTVHRGLLQHDTRYRQLLTHLVRRAIERDLPPRRHALDIAVRVPALERREKCVAED